MGRPAAVRPAHDAVLLLNVAIRNATPPIWRRLQVPAAATFADLHEVIQGAFGWQHAHLHRFNSAGRRFSPEPSGGGFGPAVEDESDVPLREVLRATGDEAVYWYDFGDDWYHDVLVEEVLPASTVAHAVCTGGGRAGPQEDSGGIWRYQDLCDALGDPKHPDHEDALEWLGEGRGGGRWDPARFDIDEINDRLRRIRLSLH
jgi:hypothetical protein